MNSRLLAYQLARHHQQRRLKPRRRNGTDAHPAAHSDSQSDWAAFLRLAIVLAVAGCAIAVLHWVHQS